MGEYMKILEELGGEYIVNKIIERSKNTDIIYLTKDTLLNTNCVKQLAEYLEKLLKERQSDKERIEMLEENYSILEKAYFTDNIPKSLIKEKIEEVNNSNGYSPVNKIFIEQVLKQLLEE